MQPDTTFWHALTTLIATHAVIIDRPRGSAHPRYPELIYPLDYGYLENTSAGDGDGIDVWLGSLSTVADAGTTKTLTGILCSFDTLKRDAEIKLLIDCSDEDIQIIRDFLRELNTLYIPNPAVEHALSNYVSRPTQR
jgi:inorganic pyrophosphatase